MRSYFNQNNTSAGVKYLLVGGILLAVIAFVYKLKLDHIPPLQFLFVNFLMIFLINYLIMRDAEVSPFVIGDENTTCKVGSVLGLFGFLCTFYAMQFISIESAMTLFLWAGVFGIIIDKLVRGADYSSSELLFCLLALAGVMFVLRPPFLFGNLGSSHYIGHWDKEGYVSHEDYLN